MSWWYKSKDLKSLNFIIINALKNLKKYQIVKEINSNHPIKISIFVWMCDSYQQLTYASHHCLTCLLVHLDSSPIKIMTMPSWLLTLIVVIIWCISQPSFDFYQLLTLIAMCIFQLSNLPSYKESDKTIYQIVYQRLTFNII